MLLKGNEGKILRESGILLHISSLPSNYGIGSFGKAAYDFVDFLKKSRQRYWQMLPLCPIGEGNSPYKSVSAFAGEILFIDLELLAEEGLIDREDLPEDFKTEKTDYRRARAVKLPVLNKAAQNFDAGNPDYLRFKRKNSYWLDDYAVFMAIKDACYGADFLDFEEGLKYRLPGAIQEFRNSHREQIRFYKITQYLFYRQYLRLKEYAHKHGVKMIGDIPFYVSLDSADVWGNPDAFRLGRDMTPVLVAGVPPDIFSKDGQLWGNPIYDWDYQKKTDFKWWRQRLVHNSELFDVIRIDHFRAFDDYYTIPYGCENAKSGTWEKGMGMAFWNSMGDTIGDMRIIAEDLGGETPEVEKLVEDTGFPNMKILQFAFSKTLQNKFLPKNYQKNCVCYTGTHDNDTTKGWLDSATEKEKILFGRLVPADRINSPVLRLVNYGMKSRAWLVIIPLQDYLELGSESRMNTPGTSKGNWEWRYDAEKLDDRLAGIIRQISKGRN